MVINEIVHSAVAFLLRSIVLADKRFCVIFRI